METEDEARGRRGTRAHTPDLDWSQVRETVLMLELATAQIEAAMGEGENSVQVLTGAFTEMAGRIAGIQGALAELPADPAVDGARAALLGDAERMRAQVHQSVLAFQFYDKLVQRLSHVCRGLEGLAELVEDRVRLFNPEEWVALQARIRKVYSTPEERAMFEAVLAGMPVREALESHRDGGAGDQGGEIELF